ncbi:MAG: TonB-dependent receptor [Burkholderiaceae bacterium]|nr:TonB-dependent receptor [Burkholderiaceae bacterium]
MNRFLRSVTMLSVTLASASMAVAEPVDPTTLSLEELLQTPVITASRKQQRLQDVAAAVFVINREDIQRSGAVSIPELLRMVPGLQVARITNSTWAVSARGFNGRFANKLQVLMDGRSIYSPLYSGAIWEVEDILLEDIERIEVMRGPGAAMWGANAVNGVINIITRHTSLTKGNLLVAGAGTEERAFSAFRHGGDLDSGHYRIWGKAYSRDGSSNMNGQQANDHSRSSMAGFRSDWTLAGGNRFMLNGAAHDISGSDLVYAPNVAAAQGFTPTSYKQSSKGAYLQARHEWLLADGSEAILQGYVNNTDVRFGPLVHEKRTTLDLDFQHRLKPIANHELIWGLGYRYSHDDTTSQGMVNISPNQRNITLASAFLHDEMTIVPERLRFIAGAKLERSTYSGTDFQPNARLIWTPTATQTIWGAISRAARTPSRLRMDGAFDIGVIPAGQAAPLPLLLHNLATLEKSTTSEKMTALDIGYRHQLSSNFSVDVAAFYNRYDNLTLIAPNGVPTLLYSPYNQPYLRQDLVFNSNMKANTRGVELVADWLPTSSWRLQPAYTYLRVNTSTPIANATSQSYAEGVAHSSPQHQFSLRASHNLANGDKFDLWLRHVSSLRHYTVSGMMKIPSYTTLDARYAWRISSKLELSLVAQNLLQRRHQEFISDHLPVQQLQVDRGIYLKAVYKF